jgi:CBS domain-containing protein
MKAEAQNPPLIHQLVAGDIMTGPAVACRDETLFEEIAEILADRDISGMPVVNERGDVVGVISERDLAHALGGPMVKLAVRRRNHAPFRGALHERSWGARRAKDIMTAPAITVASNVHLDEVARVMRFHQINRVPVVDAGRLIGVITRGDVLGAIAHVEHTEIDLTKPVVLVGNASIHRD